MGFLETRFFGEESGGRKSRASSDLRPRVDAEQQRRQLNHSHRYEQVASVLLSIDLSRSPLILCSRWILCGIFLFEDSLVDMLVNSEPGFLVWLLPGVRFFWPSFCRVVGREHVVGVTVSFRSGFLFQLVRRLLYTCSCRFHNTFSDVVLFSGDYWRIVLRFYHGRWILIVSNDPKWFRGNRRESQGSPWESASTSWNLVEQRGTS